MLNSRFAALVTAVIVFQFSLQLQGAPTDTVAEFVGDTWEVISNHWGAMPLAEVRQAADKNDWSAQYYLGISYLNGYGVPEDDASGFKWVLRAAQQGYIRAQRKVGDYYYEGIGVAQDYVAAAKYYRIAAEHGDASAQVSLGWQLKKGLGVDADDNQACYWFAQAAQQGEPMGAQNLAWMYVTGRGTNRNNDLAEQWYLRSVDTNSTEGKYEVAKFIMWEMDDQKHEIETNFYRAAEWLRPAAEQGHAAAQYELADLYDSGKLGSPTEIRSNCIPWYIKSASNGNAEAQSRLSELSHFYPNSELLKSLNVVDSLKQAADQDNLNAEFNLAFRYHHGDGVTRDDVEAFKWIKKAAAHEITAVTMTIDAHYYLGLMYELGMGTPQNLTNAFQLYQQAATGGNKPDPFVHLAALYELGLDGTTNDLLAAQNYVTAIQFGFLPSSDDTARGQAIEGLLSLYSEGRGLPDGQNVIAAQLEQIKSTPVRTAKAQWLFGKIYSEGKIVARDLPEADAWFHLAESGHFAGATTDLKKVEAQLSPEQKSAADNRFIELTTSVEQADMIYEASAAVRKKLCW